MQFVVLAIKLSGKTLFLPRQAMLLFLTEHLAGRQSLAQIIDLLAEGLQFPLTRCELGAQFRGRLLPFGSRHNCPPGVNHAGLARARRTRPGSSLSMNDRSSRQIGHAKSSHTKNAYGIHRLPLIDRT